MLAEAEAIHLAHSEEIDFAPLALSVERLEPAGAGASFRPDWLLTAEWQGRVCRFAVEYKSTGTPKQLEAAISQAQKAATRADFLPMVMAPYLSRDSLDRLIEASVSGIDFSGNGVVLVPGTWFILKTGSRNRFPSSAPIQAIYSGTSSLVGRILLLEPEFLTVTAVRDRILRRGGSISLSTVSKVLSALEEDLVASKAPTIRATQPEMLLVRLVEGFDRPEVSRTIRGRLDVDSEQFRSWLREDKGPSSGRAALSGEGEYVVFPGSEQLVRIYTDSISRLTNAVEFQATERFPDVELVETDDQRVYFDPRLRRGLLYTSPLQTYLELATGGKREAEVAEQMKQDLLERRYQ